MPNASSFPHPYVTGWAMLATGGTMKYTTIKVHTLKHSETTKHAKLAIGAYCRQLLEIAMLATAITGDSRQYPAIVGDHCPSLAITVDNRR